jgi:hypothetical protein
MNTDFSASASGKTTTGAPAKETPFDQIAKLEKLESSRIATETDAMEEERHEVEQALKEKEDIGEQEIKDAARTELVEYRETELSTIVRAAESEADSTIKRLEKDYLSREDAIAKKLLEQALDKNSPLLQS